MKIRDNRVIIETFAEASEVHEYPTAWDLRAGGEKCAFCAAYHLMKTSEAFAERAVLEFATPRIESYFNRLDNANWKYRFFDFELGAESQFEDLADRPADNNYLLAAKYIATQGQHAFAISLVETDHARGVKFEREGRSYTFEDITDQHMFESALSLLIKRNGEAREEKEENTLDDFIKE